MFLLFSQIEAELTEAQDNRLTIQVITVVQYSRNSLLRPLNIWCHVLLITLTILLNGHLKFTINTYSQAGWPQKRGSTVVDWLSLFHVTEFIRFVISLVSMEIIAFHRQT